MKEFQFDPRHALSCAGEAAISRYEKLLLLKNDLERECFHLEQEHTREFGAEVLEIFRRQIECVQKVRTIEFCRMYLDRGEDPDGEALRRYVQQDTQELMVHFHAMQRTYENAKSAAEVSDADPNRNTLTREAPPDIPDVEEKIRELEWAIREIRGNEPYRYRFLFASPEAVQEKHRDLRKQADEYREYGRQLDERLNAILPEGTFLFWSEEG